MIAAVCYSIWAHASRAADGASAANASDVVSDGYRGCVMASEIPGFACAASQASRSASGDGASRVSNHSLSTGASDPRSKR